MKRKIARAAVPSEMLDTAVSELLEYAARQGAAINDRLADDDDDDDDDDVRSVKPSIRDLLASNLRAALEDELIPATPMEGGGIAQSEVDHEIAKKALIGLKVASLRQIARDMRVPVSGNAEELASRIAYEYGWNAEEIARLVIRYEPEPEPERGHVSRLFSTQVVEDLDDVEQRLGIMAGRYVRVGVAKWFTFNRVDRANVAALVVHGSYRSYRARVKEVGEDAGLDAEESVADARMTITTGTEVEVAGSGAVAAKAAIAAVELSGGATALGYVPLAGAGAVSTPGVVHESSEFLLDILHTRLTRAGFSGINPTIVRFKLARDEDIVEEARRPALRAVRIEGEHLFDSVDASRLISAAGRPLVEISLRLSYPHDEHGKAAFPVKIALEGDHVMVATGFGSAPEASGRVHALITEAVRDEMGKGRADRHRLDALLLRFSERAEAAVTPDEANMLADADAAGSTDD